MRIERNRLALLPDNELVKNIQFKEREYAESAT